MKKLIRDCAPAMAASLVQRIVARAESLFTEPSLLSFTGWFAMLCTSMDFFEGLESICLTDLHNS